MKALIRIIFLSMLSLVMTSESMDKNANSSRDTLRKRAFVKHFSNIMGKFNFTANHEFGIPFPSKEYVDIFYFGDDYSRRVIGNYFIDSVHLKNIGREAYQKIMDDKSNPGYADTIRMIKNMVGDNVYYILKETMDVERSHIFIVNDYTLPGWMDIQMRFWFDESLL